VSSSAATDAVVGLVGREAEARLVDELVDGLSNGGGALIVRGEPGIGKSALLEHARERVIAAGGRVLSTVGDESEAELAFAGLHQLLHPIIGLTQRLSEAQRRAIAAAFGVSGEVEPDPFRVALAAFQLVCDAADAGAVVLIVDDAQWLDRSTMGVLTFIARRLDSEPVALVAAVRAGHPTPLDDVHLPSLELERLSGSAAAMLLDQHAPELHPIFRARILSEAAGNPLALVELAREATNAVADYERIAPVPTTLTARLEQAFAARLDDLPSVTQSALLAAALDSRASVAEIVRCVQSVQQAPVAADALDAAVDVGLVAIVEGEVRFRHPLIRSAVRQAVGRRELQTTYAALASVVDDPERRLWHRAMATDAPDEDIATALEDHARAAQRRGAVTVAGAALERAAALSVDTHWRIARLVTAAELAYELGLANVVRRLLDQTDALELDPLNAARTEWLREMVTGNVWYESGAARTFVRIAEQMRDAGEVDIALRSLVPIAHRSWWTQTQARTRQYLVEAALGMGVPDDDPRVLVVIALADPEHSASVRERVARKHPHDIDDPIAAMDVGIAAEKACNFAAGARFLSHAVERLRAQVRLGPLTQALVHLAWAAVHTGEWEVAAAASAEGARLARDTRQPQYGLTGELIAALVTALRGSEQDFEAVVAKPERTLQSMKGGPLLATAHLARGAAAIGDGRHDEALRHLWPVFDDAQPAFHQFMRWSGLVDLVEAAVGCGQAHRLGDLLADLEHIAERSGSPFLHAELAAARPLLAADDDAERLFVVAIGPALRDHPFLRARTQFSFGRWLRRQRRPADSRTPLRESIDVFDMLGASQWSKRARQELRATGERIGQRTPDLRDRLTGQELQIAQLAGEGLSNREIGERLFLSHRTVGGHLYRIFPKLGVTNRAQLGNALK
jgi:DNA-binding CsgD family transcriptional regulator